MSHLLKRGLQNHYRQSPGLLKRGTVRVKYHNCKLRKNVSCFLSQFKIQISVLKLLSHYWYCYYQSYYYHLFICTALQLARWVKCTLLALDNMLFSFVIIFQIIPRVTVCSYCMPLAKISNIINMELRFQSGRRKRWGTVESETVCLFADKHLNN